jgi:PAS domain S-box-containing protein
MLDFLRNLFDTSDFPPRWDCGNWTTAHGWLHILSDLGVWSAYVAIPCVLGYFVLRRKDIPFRSVFMLFVAFILACGTTHLMESLIFWWPAYRLSGVIKLFTAVVSWATVVALVPVLPKALAMRNPDELEREIVARNEAERAFQQANADLERQVEALRASEERFRLLVDGTTDHAIFMLDASGRIASWNPGAERIKQYRADEIVGQHFSRFYPAEDIRAGRPELGLRMASQEGRFEEEGWRLRKDGSRFWANAVITALPDASGKLRGYSKVTRDMTQRKQAEEDARRLLEEAAARRAAEQYAQLIEAQREQLRVTLSSIGDGVITTDVEGRVTLLNSVAETLTGWTNAEATGQSLTRVFPILNEQTRVVADNPVEKALRLGSAVGLANHTVLISKDGTERPIDDSAAPIKNEQGETIGVVLVFRDATEQRRVEAADRKNREILRLVHQIGRIGHWEWNAQTDENNWSRELETLYGLPPGEFEGGYEGWAKLLHPDDRAKAEADVRRAFETGEYFTEFRVIWPDGSVHWLETRANVLRDGQDNPARIVGVNMDVTERKQQEEALRASEQRWRTMAEALPNLVWTDLPDGQCDWLSSQWGKFTGIPENDLLGLRWLETVIHPDDRERTRACWEAACADRADYDLEYRIRRHDGEYHWFKTRGVPIRDERGEITYWFGTCTDIEDVKRLEAALLETDRRKNEFLATLAHELRNPLAPVRHAVELLRHYGGDAERVEQTRGMMDRQLSHMVRLVDELLDMSRISRGSVQLRLERVDLASAIRSAVESARPLIESQAHKLTVTLPPEPIYLNADSTRLAQVVSNLLNNAAKYTEKGGHIWLTAKRQGNEAVISVGDTGIGIRPEHLPHVFEMFSQVAPALERSQGGLGIGLSLVRGLVELHGGVVEARSRGVGKGSEFIVRLPVVETPAPSETPEPPAFQRMASGRMRRILVVDDNRDAADGLALMLRVMGHETRTAYDGLESLQAAANFRPDVVLLDIGLPKMNGYEVAQEIRKEPWGKGMALIALTGWGQEDDKRRALDAGFDHHLTKPVEAAVLAKLLALINPVPLD